MCALAVLALEVALGKGGYTIPWLGQNWYAAAV